jgi:hypothetical protein
MKWSLTILRHYIGICLEELRPTTYLIYPSLLSDELTTLIIFMSSRILYDFCNAEIAILYM